MAICFCGHPFFPFLLSWLFFFLSFSAICTQTVSFTRQELPFIYMRSICLNDSKTDSSVPSISQPLCGDINKLENLWILFLVHYSNSKVVAALSVTCIYFQAQDPVAQNSTMLSSRTPWCSLLMSPPDCRLERPVWFCKHQAGVLQNQCGPESSIFL